MKVSDIKIGTRLAGAFGMLVVFLVALSAYGTLQIDNSAALIEKLYQHPFTVGTKTRDIVARINGMHRSMKDVALSKNEEDLNKSIAEVDRLQNEVFAFFTIVAERFLGDKTAVEEARKTFADWQTIRQEVISLTKEGRHDEAAQIIKDREAIHVKLLDEKIDFLVDYADQKAIEFHSNAETTKAEVHKVMLLVSGGAVFVAILISFLITKGIITPLKALTASAARMSKGDLRIEFNDKDRRDEIGDLINSFSEMQSSLRLQTVDIIEGTSTLASSINEISSTSSQLAASASETSTTIAQVSTTVEEVRSTAQLATEKTDQINQEAERASRISKEGTIATDNAISGMQNISEEMEYVAESIMKLSEQTQNIGDIIGAVNDLTDQSNLLSVNASIEAAKAGEYGKGFAVVAQEVKSLAEQSKEATGQIRTILNEIQKATTASVLATERGSKSVQSGLKLANKAGQTILELSSSVDEFSEAAMQIGASSRQQLSGMDQLVDAITNIKEATFQNVDGAKQLEAASQNLNELGAKLKDLTSKFKV